MENTKHSDEIKALSDICNDVAYGKYDKDDVKALFDLTKGDADHSITRLSESFGFMLVKIESRELALEKKIDDLKKANAIIDKYSKELELKVQERTKELRDKNQALEQEIKERQKIQKALEKANDKLTMISNQDGLTGLANRRRFDEYIKKEWESLKREKQSLGLILCDVDHFKLYNDTYGHQMGDECLKQIARTIGECMNRPRDMAARYGGEEFAAILPNTDIKGALEIAEQIRAQVEALNIPHESSKVCDHATISLGVACVVPDPEKNEKQLIEMADSGLYEAKERGGRNCARVKQTP